MIGSLFMQHTPSRFTKVAEPHAAPAQSPGCPLRHAHPAFTRFMAAHPVISRFVAEHPRMSRFVFRVAHHIPVIDKYVPLAAHISPVFHQRAMRPRRPGPRF